MNELEVIDIDTNEVLFDFQDGNGLVSAHKHSNGGGWVADTATVEDSCFVSIDARVYGNAVVSGNAKVYDKARVYDNAKIFDNARVCGSAKVYGNALVCNNAMVYGEALVYDDAKVRNNTQVYDLAIIRDKADLTGDIKIYSDCIVTRKAISILGFDVPITITDNLITLGEYAISPSQIKDSEYIDEEWKELLQKIAEFHGCTDEQ